MRGAGISKADGRVPSAITGPQPGASSVQVSRPGTTGMVWQVLLGRRARNDLPRRRIDLIAAKNAYDSILTVIIILTDTIELEGGNTRSRSWEAIECCHREFVANYGAILSVGESLLGYLRNAYPQELRDETTCEFKLVSSNELAAPNLDFGTAITLFLHRVTIDTHLRNNRIPVGAFGSHVPVSLDLHYLLTIWADSSKHEQLLLGWVIRELYQHEALSQSDLTPAGGWSAEDVIQVIPGEISNRPRASTCGAPT